MVGYQSKKHQK